MSQLRVAFVGAHAEVARRLPEVLSSQASSIAYVGCPAEPLHDSPFLTSHTRVGNHADCHGFVAALIRRRDVLDSLPAWTLWTNDVDLIRVVRSPLDPATKARILPARTPAGMSMLGSKTGLAAVLADAGIVQPAFTVAEEPVDLVKAAQQAGLAYPLLVKGERGGGGTRVRPVESPYELAQAEIPAHWYPLLLQEVVPGDEVSVEALFGDGGLLGWAYAEPVVLEEPFGRTTVRRYLDPPRTDFVEPLQRVAPIAGLHGFANCTFIRTPDDRHVLVEVDMRANTWHQFGPQLGVDWGSLMGTPPDSPMHPHLGPSMDTIIHLYPREIVHGIATRDWAALRPWAARQPGTWKTRNHRDRVIGRAERLEILEEAARLPRRIARRLRSPR